MQVEKFNSASAALARATNGAFNLSISTSVWSPSTPRAGVAAVVNNMFNNAAAAPPDFIIGNTSRETKEMMPTCEGMSVPIAIVYVL